MSETAGRDAPKKGLGSLIWSMAALWMGPANDPADFDDLPRRIGPAVLVLWTAAGVALAGLLSVGRQALGMDHPLGVAVAAPMFLPLLLGLIRLPVRRVPALSAALPAGAVPAVLLGLAPADPFGTYWATFTGLAVGILTAAAVYGAIARPAP